MVRAAPSLACFVLCTVPDRDTRLRCIRGDRTRHEVHASIAKQVARGAGDVIAGRRLERVANETAGCDLFQVNNGIESLGLTLRETVGRQVGDGNDVLPTLAREVGRDGAMGAVKRSDRTMLGL